MRGNSKPWYDTAQVCMNGHLITPYCESDPSEMKNFCPKCGSKTITQCLKCNTEILGKRHYPGVIGTRPKKPADYCHSCGNPYPWTEKAMEAVKELIDISHVSDEEKESLKNDLGDLSTDTPRTNLAATKMANFLEGLGNELKSATRDLIVDIASETAKKIIFPDGK